MTAAIASTVPPCETRAVAAHKDADNDNQPNDDKEEHLPWLFA